MSRAPVRARLPLRILLTGLGTGLFVYLIWRAGPSKLIADVVALRWGVVLIIVLAGCSHLAKAWAWALMLRNTRQKVPFSRLFALRLGAEAMGQLGIVGQTFGDSIRISYLSSEVPAARGVFSVSLDRGLFFATGTVITIAGITTAALVLPLPHGLSRFAGIFVGVLCGFLLSTALVVHRRWPVLSGATASLGRLTFFRSWVDKNWRPMRSVENMLFDFYHQTPRAFWASFALNLACHVMAVGEVCFIVYFLGARINFLSALAIEALTKLVNAVGNLNPGNIGTYEAGNVLIGKMFGLNTSAALALGLSRRVRALFWAAVGGVVLFLVTKPSQRSSGNRRNCGSGLSIFRHCQCGCAQAGNKSASASIGFQGKCAIHPAQIATVNEVFTPTAEEVAKAHQILLVNQQGVGSVDHQMVDEAVARKARLILERAGTTTGK